MSKNPAMNTLKLPFYVLIMLAVLICLLAYFVKSNLELSKQLASLKSASSFESTSTSRMFVNIDPYRLENENGKTVAIFHINNLNKQQNVSQMVYWTDKNGACKSKKQTFSEFVKVPLSEIEDYVFFQFTDDKGLKSQIYASTQNPIFQCGSLAE